MTAPAPELSVVIPFVNEPADLAGCLAALERAGPGLEAVVVDRVGAGAEVAAGRPWVRVLPAAPATPVPMLRAAGCRAARGRVVGVIEDHVHVAPDWARVLLAATGPERPVVGGAVENLATARLVDWAAFLCEYSRLLPPAPDGPVEWLGGNNVGYLRPVLERYLGVLDAGGWEDRLHAAMRADGVVLTSRPDLRAGHKMHYTIGFYTTQRYLFSRAWAGARHRGAPLAQRIATGAALCALPPVLFWRVVTTVWRHGRHRRELIRSLPLLVWFAAVWGAGEVAGAWFGPGDAPGRVR